MFVIVAWIGGFFILSTVVSLIMGPIIARSTLSVEEYERRVQRDNELVSTFVMLEERLGRTPTTAEVWAEAPPWFDSQETA